MFQKITAITVCFIFLVCSLCACCCLPVNNESDYSSSYINPYTSSYYESSYIEPYSSENNIHEESVVTEASDTKQSGEVALADWKTAYLDYISTIKDEFSNYALIYIDNDNIPELYLNGMSEATGDMVCSYKNGTVISQQLGRTGGGSYIEKSGKFINQNGNMGNCYTEPFELTENGFVSPFYGSMQITYEELENGEFNEIYKYSIDGVTVSEDEYNAKIAAFFDFSQAKMLGENRVSYDEIVQQITNF